MSKRSDIMHPVEFMDGTRLLLLKSRHKDGWVGKERAITRASHFPEEFLNKLDELRTMIQPGERIYASASPRNIVAAARKFNEQLVASLLDPPAVRDHFYKTLPHRWYSALMQRECSIRDNKWWMWDCDDDRTLGMALSFVAVNNLPHRTYATKSGNHVLVRPFDVTLVPKALMVPDQNPLILWSFCDA